MVIWEMFHAGIFQSTFLQPVNGSKNSILNWVMKHNLFNLIFLVNFSLKLPIKLYAAVASGRYVQAMLLHSEKVSEMHLSANWKPKFKDWAKQTVKKLNLLGKTAVDKSAWIKAYHGRIYLNSVFLLLLVSFVSGFRLELMYISLIVNVRSSLISTVFICLYHSS